MSLTPATILKASCLCGKASIELRGPPIDYCHCTSCQTLHSAPYAFVAVRCGLHSHPITTALFTRSRQRIQSRSRLYRCRNCGVALCGWVKRFNVWGIYVGTITLDGKWISTRDFPEFEGVTHMFYGERQRDIKSIP